jgi:predicted RNA-binding protein YlxR (DUF448 family)
VGCRERAAKSELDRVVRTPDGRIQMDPKGQAPGRGAYVHRTGQCLQRAVRTGALARGLRVPLAEPEAARLEEELMKRGEVR